MYGTLFLIILLSYKLISTVNSIQDKSYATISRNILKTDNTDKNNNNTILNISTITWNLAEKSPLDKDCIFLQSYRKSDIVVIGIQECEDIRPRRNEGRRSKRWKQLQREGLGKSFVSLAQHKLGGMQIGVFVKKKYSKLVKGMQLLEVACGIGNVVANKGAVMVLLRVLNKSILFVNAHLAAHQNKVKERNKDYERIVNTIIDKVDPKWKIKSSSPKMPKVFSRKIKSKKSLSKSAPSNSETTNNWYNSFDSIVFLGDLNYRTDLPRLEIEKWYEEYKRNIKIQKEVNYDDLYSLIDYDQLKREIYKNKVFKGFNEGIIKFPPTFKYDKGSDKLDSSGKSRSPAWTDRILYSNNNNNDKINTCSLRLNKYYSIDVRSSDHRPVCAEFDLHL